MGHWAWGIGQAGSVGGVGGVGGWGSINSLSPISPSPHTPHTPHTPSSPSSPSSPVPSPQPPVPKTKDSELLVECLHRNKCVRRKTISKAQYWLVSILHLINRVTTSQSFILSD
ncbi:MAG: hypothetical protein RMY29_014040 [Nostoc sp. CreGUA01]|nr:hypothetical protein [Nostoc sp. CreGUA01]